MNINEVPQDAKNYKGGEKMRKLLYAVGKDGQYTGVNSQGWEPENDALKHAWDDVDERIAATLTEVREGTLSPVAYYMQKNLMDVPLLARYAGKWQWQVRRHLQPRIFARLSAKMLKVYAGIFNITIEELQDIGKRTDAE